MRVDGTREEIPIPDVWKIPPPAQEPPPEPTPITAVFTGFSGHDLFFNRGSIRARVPAAEMAMLAELQAGDLVEIVQRGKRYRCIKTLDDVNSSDIRMIRALFRPGRIEEELQLQTSPLI